MTRIKKLLRYRAPALFLSVVMLFGLIPINKISVNAAGAQYGTLSGITAGGTAEDESGDHAVITYSSETILDWAEADSVAGRLEDGWWVGIKMTAPDSMTTQADFESEDKRVTYQTMDGNGNWSAAKSFWDAQDSDSEEPDAERYLTMWGLVNEEMLNEAVLRGTHITYQWQFDWDKDDTYEQTATLEIDPVKVTLKKGDETVYPTAESKIGAVQNLSKGFSVANENANIVTVSGDAEKIGLDWVAQNEGGINRPADGWWVGCKVTAPNMSKEELAKAKFQTKSGSDGVWSGENQFSKYKDSADGAAEQYIGLWSLVTPEILTNAGKGTVDYAFRFDWDGNGVYEQLVLLKIDPAKMVLTDENGVQAYPVLGKVTPLCGGAVRQADGKFVVSNESASMTITAAARDDAAGRKQDGWWAGVKVEKPAWADADAAKFQVQVDGKYPADEGDSGNLFSRYADDEEKTYIGLWAFLGDDADEIKAKDRITAGWRFDWDGDGNYEQEIELHIDTTKNLELYTVDQSKPFVFDTPKPFIIGTSDESKLSYSNPAQGGSGDGKVTYAIASDDSGAEINSETGEVTFEKDTAGKFTVTAEKEANGIYNAAGPISYDLYLAKSEYTVTYGANGNIFENPIAKYAQNFDHIHYTVVSQSPLVDTDEAVAEVDEATGKVTIHKAGSVKIQAEWNGQTFEYTLTVNRADAAYTANAQAMYGELTGSSTELASGETVNEKYGITALAHTLEPPKDADKINFTVSVEENKIGATVDGTTVKIADSAAKTGSVEVTVHRAADSRYNEINFTYTLEIEYADDFPTFDEKTWLDGKTKNNSGWYTDDVTITPSKGYHISFSDSLSAENWNASVTVNQEGENEKQVYVRNDETGYISRAIDCGIIKMDKTAPAAEDMTIAFSELTLIQKIGSALGFYNPNITITFTAKDYTSGIDHFDCTYTREENVSALNKATTTEEIAVNYVPETHTATAELTLPAEKAEQLRGKISFTATDKAGNESVQKAEDYVFIVDTISPTVDVKYSAYSYRDEKTGRTFYGKTVEDSQIDGTVDVIFTVNEANFYKEDVSITLVKFDDIEDASGTDTDISNEVVWTDESTDVHTGKYTIKGEGHYIVKFSYHDKSYREGAEKNGTVTTYSTPEKITIDTTDPTIAVTYTPEEATENEKFFNSTREAIVTVVEHNFRPEDLEVAVEAKDANGKSIPDEDQVAKTIADQLKNPESWTSKGDTHTAAVPFTTDAQYNKFTIDYKDLAGNQAKQYSAPAFVIDQKEPSEPVIEYSTHINFWDAIVHAVTFGYYTYNPSVTVTVTASDEIAGIDYFDWTYTKENGTSDVNADEETGRLDITTAEDQADKKTATASFTLTADEAKQYRGSISATAVDNATNSTDKSDNTRVNIVDALSPKINVSYSAEEAIVRYTDAELHDVEDFPSAARAFFNNDVKATVSINEANFFEGQRTDEGEVIHEIGILLTKTDSDGNVTKTEYLPAGAKQRYESESAVPQTFEWTTVGDLHTFEITYSDNADYVLTVDYADFSKNDAEITADDGNTATKTYTSKPITVDKSKPTIEVAYGNTDVRNTFRDSEGHDRQYFDKAQTATITIAEHNFRPDDVIIRVKAKDVTGENALPDSDNDGYADSYADEGQSREEWAVLSPYTDKTNWRRDDNTFKLDIDYTSNANYTFDIEYKDLAGNDAAVYPSDYFTVDTTVATNLQIDYTTPIIEKVIDTLTFGFYQEKVDVTLTAEDMTAGVDYFEWTYTRETGASDVNAESSSEPNRITSGDITYTEKGKTAEAHFSIPANARGYITADAFDKSTNTSKKADTTKIKVVDKIPPKINVTYSAEEAIVRYTDDDLHDVEDFPSAARAFFNKDVKATIAINEANFFEGVTAEDGVIHKIGILLTKTDSEGNVTKTEYLPAGAKQRYESESAVTQTFEWTTVGDLHTFEITYSEDADYVLTVDYTDFSKNEAEITANDGNTATKTYTSKPITVDKIEPTIAAAYDPAEATANKKFFNTNRSMTVTIVDHSFRADDLEVTVTAKDANGDSIPNEEQVQKDISDYLTDRTHWTNTGDTHVATVPFTVDAQYAVTINYSDLIKNAAAPYVAPSFVIDHVAPSEPVITYSTHINFWEEIVHAVTFGYYTYNPSVTVTVTASDEIAGIDCFDWTYTKENGTSDVHADEETGRLDITAAEDQADKKTATASFTLTADEAKQYRGSISATAVDNATNATGKSDDTRINIVDTISPTRVVTYSDAKQVVDAATLQTRSTYEYSGENTNAILYYDDTVTVTAKITEANFYAEDVVIKDNDTVITPNNWTQNGDEWTATFALAAEGDHIVTMQYTDRSNNTMTDYQSQRIVIDRTAPVIEVTYGNTDVKNTIRDSEGHDRQYFDKAQTATIAITEHNFRPDDVIVHVKARNVIGENIRALTFDQSGNAVEYANEAASREEWAKLTPFMTSWRRVDDRYELVIDYENDANYTFDVSYRDLALNSSSAYSADYFTVDQTAPENLGVAYSTNVFENVLESVTFGYYNAQMTVTLMAEDDTSGIYHFLYSYVKSEGVSNVNAELIDDAISSAAIRYDGAKATTEFTIPKYLLGTDNQFNGTVRFTAFDRAENKTDMSDTERIVVDNLKPTVHVSFSEPVRTYNNISYYANTASVRVDINEANFFEEDVRITVTRDGSSYVIRDLNWSHISVDEHYGTFTLPDDGDYIVFVTYTDRSGNVMDSYKSERITVDKTKPTVSVSPVKNNSANKDKAYAFTITANDTNMDAATFKPVLTALVKNENGTYTEETIPLGDMQAVEEGKTYSFTVPNLDADAAYTLTSTVKDMSGNEYTSIRLDDSIEYGSVQFSINRNGSTFAVDRFTANLIEQYYVYSVDQDVVIEEINVDPIENYVVKLNGEVLQEGSDYTTSITNRDGEWSKRTYAVHRNLFEQEGEYSIVVESTDKALSTAYSDVKNLKIAFVVDQTAPVLTVSGIQDNGRYQVSEQTVTVIPTDDGGRLYSFKAIVFDADGNPLKKNGEDVSVRLDLSGEEFLQYLEEHEGKIVFTIPEGLENQVQLICNDCAVKADGTTNEYNYTYTKVTVSPSGWVIFYANKPLFYGSIGGVVLLAGLVIGLIIFLKKRKKAEQETE